MILKRTIPARVSRDVAAGVRQGGRRARFGLSVARGVFFAAGSALLAASFLLGGWDARAREESSSSSVRRMATHAEQEDFRFAHVGERMRKLEERVDQLAFQVSRLQGYVRQELQNDRGRAEDAPVFFTERSAASAGGASVGRVEGGAGRAVDRAAESAYESAYEFVLLRDFLGAEAAFADFLHAYPNHALSGRARYWLGESYFLQGKFQRAVRLFAALHQEGEAADGRGPDILLRLATSLAKVGETARACFYFARLRGSFPDASPWIGQEADRESGRIGC